MRTRKSRREGKFTRWTRIPCFIVVGLIWSSTRPVTWAEDVRLRASGIEAVVVDNGAWEEHSARYNGLAFLSVGQGFENIFKPRYGGFDLENYIDRVRQQSPHTPQDHNMLFEPRNIPMKLSRVSADTVELHELPGPQWGVETWARFRVRSPRYIDVQFWCIPRQRLAQGKFLGLFWANYVNAPEDGGYYFLGQKTPDSPVEWIRAYSMGRNDKATFLPDQSPVKIDFDPGYGGWMWNHPSDVHYKYPFFYGIVKGQTFILMLDHKENIRFSHSPTGGGGTPAWDFQFIIPDYQVGKKYGFRARVVVKKFISREDVIQEYERWSKQKVSIASAN